MLKLYVLGRVQAHIKGDVVLETRKSQAMLMYLALHDIPLQRDRLAALFWPSLDQANARKSLRQALYSLKTVLSERYITSDRHSISLIQSNVWVDADDFKSQLVESVSDLSGLKELKPESAANLSQALSLYSGEFMQGFSLPACPTFDDWQYYQAETYREYYINALSQLADYYTQESNFPLAISTIQKILLIDQFNEALQRELLKVYTWMDRKHIAINHYETYAAALAEELGTEPEEETQQLVQTIESGTLAPPERLLKVTESVVLSTTERKDNLPQRLTPFIGRDKELQDLTQYFHQKAMCLVSIIATGGMGKTRLALELATTLLRKNIFSDGVYVVYLAGTEDLSQSIAEALGLSLVGNLSAQQQIINQLEHHDMLLLLDNFEEVMDDKAVLQTLLSGCQNLKLLVTSRERLQLPAEWVYELSGLDGENEAYADAICLFEERAKQLQRSFQIGPNRDAVLEICKIVNAMPLGIELAASWVNTLSVQDIALHLKQNLFSLVTNNALVPERHQSLGTVVEQTWHRLSSFEQTVYERLAIFKSGFSYSAAEAVASATYKDLATFANKSLLKLSKGRYELHEVLRQYAYSQLIRDQESLDKTAEAHALYYAQLLQNCEADLKTSQQLNAQTTISMELDNILAGWTWASNNAALELINMMVPGLSEYCEMQGRMPLALKNFQQVLPLYKDKIEQCSNIHQGYVKLLVRLALSSFRGRDLQYTKILIEEAKAHLGVLQTDKPSDYAYALALISSIHNGFESVDTAVLDAKQARDSALSLKDDWLLGICCLCLAENLLFSGQCKQSIDYFAESIQAFETVGEERYKAFSLNNMGRAYLWMGQYEDAKRKASEALVIRKRFRDHVGIAISLLTLGATEVALNNSGTAKSYLQESLDLCNQLGLVHAHGCRVFLTRLAINQGDLEEAKLWLLQNSTSLVVAENGTMVEGLLPIDLNARAYIHLLEKELEQAHELLMQSLAINQDGMHFGERAETLFFLALCTWQENPENLTKAVSYYQEALTAANVLGASPQALSFSIAVDRTNLPFI